MAFDSKEADKYLREYRENRYKVKPSVPTSTPLSLCMCDIRLLMSGVGCQCGSEEGKVANDHRILS